MIRRLILMMVTGLALLCTWIACFAVVIILIFQSRHPDHCMAEYYNFFLPENVEYKCN